LALLGGQVLGAHKITSFCSIFYHCWQLSHRIV
jgi:hypothetical protein